MVGCSNFNQIFVPHFGAPKCAHAVRVRREHGSNLHMHVRSQVVKGDRISRRGWLCLGV